MNASNLARDLRAEATRAAQGLDQAAETLDGQASLLRTEAERIRDTPRDAVGAEQAKASLLLGVRSLADASKEIATRADLLAASANAPEMGVSSRMLATALGVSTNTAIKRIRQASETEVESE